MQLDRFRTAAQTLTDPQRCFQPLPCHSTVTRHHEDPGVLGRGRVPLVIYGHLPDHPGIRHICAAVALCILEHVGHLYRRRQ